MHLFLLLGQNTTAPSGSDSPLGGFGGMLIPIVLMLVAFYFLMVLPMRRQEKQKQALLSALKKNDKVITSSGIIGIVASVKEKEDEVTLKVDETSNFRIRVTRSSIAKIVTSEEAAKENKDTKEGGA